MKVVFRFLVASLFVVGAYGWIHRSDSPVKDPVLKRLNFVCMPAEFNLGPMKADETKYISTTCAKAECSSDGFVTYVGCYTLAVESHCKVEQGGSLKQYPHCCGVAVC